MSTGLKYPLEFDSFGKLKLSSDYELIQESIISILETRLSERVYSQAYGTPEYIWEVLAPVVLAEDVHRALRQGLPTVTFEVSSTEPDDSGAHILTIIWQIDELPKNTLRLKLNP